MSRVTEWAADPYTGGRRGAHRCRVSRVAPGGPTLDVLDLRDRTFAPCIGRGQRVYLARAVYRDPAVYLLDEPTTHLDMFYGSGYGRDRRPGRQAGKTICCGSRPQLGAEGASRLFL